MSSLWSELKRRNVIRIGVLYAVAGWLLLQVADILFGLLDVPGWGLRLVFGILLLGFPLALIFAWVYELTPEGLKRDSDVDRTRPITPLMDRRIDRLIIFGLVAVVAVLLGDRMLTISPSRNAADATAAADLSATQGGTGAIEDPLQKSIAVLPFVNMSGDKENEYFSDGLTEELLNMLANVGGLRVSSRTSSFAFKGKDSSIPTVARELRVGHILEGSVRKSGMHVRITAQLIDVETDSHLWSETYDRKLDDIFAIQDEIANAVVEALKVRLLASGTSAAPVRREQSTDAYLRYLRGRHLYELGKDTDDISLIRQAMAMYEAALEVNPESALAYAGLSDAYGRLSIQNEYTMTEGYERSREMAMKALAIDPDLVEALLALADVQLEYDWDMDAAEASYRRALQLRPSDAEGLRTYGYFLVSDGRFDEAVEYYRKALEVDPLQTRAYSGLASALMFAGRYDELAEVAERLAQHVDAARVARWRRSLDVTALRFQGKYAESIALIDEEPDRIGDLVDAAIDCHFLGRNEEARAYLDRLIRLAEERSRFYSSVAAVYAQMGEAGPALEYLQKSVDVREVNNAFIRIDPDLTPLRNEPGYLQLLERAGLKPPP